MKKILIWGFYHQGNLGDDLMATFFYEMLEEMGHLPIIYSRNPRFKRMGYKIISNLSIVSADAILLGGGAFFKAGRSPNSDIERDIHQLANFIKSRQIPVFGLSLGSDGVHRISEISEARRMVVESPFFLGSVVRLKRDLELGLSNLHFLPDVVLLTEYCCSKYSRISSVNPEKEAPSFLINLSRRSIVHLPNVLWIAKGQASAFFRAHTGRNKTGGEITLPILPTIDTDDIRKELGYLRHAKTIASSKLHPGIIAMSFGSNFIPISPTDKVKEFLRQHETGLLSDRNKQENIWQSYISHIRKFLTKDKISN